MTGPVTSQAEWLTVRDTAGLLHVGEETVRRWIRAGRIEAKFLGGRAGYRVRHADLQVFLSIQGASGAPDQERAAEQTPQVRTAGRQ